MIGRAIGPGFIGTLARFARAGGGTAVIAMAARVSGQIAMVAVTLVATRKLAPADFGVFAIAGALVMLARTMLYTGPFEYLLKAPVEREDAVSGACLAATLLVASGWVLLLGVLGLAAPVLFKGGGVAPVILALAPSVLFAAVAAIAESLMLRSGAVRRYYAITVGVEVGAGIAAIVLLLAGWGLWALVAQIYVRLALLVLALSSHTARGLPTRRLLRTTARTERGAAATVPLQPEFRNRTAIGPMSEGTGLGRRTAMIFCQTSGEWENPKGLLGAFRLLVQHSRQDPCR